MAKVITLTKLTIISIELNVLEQYLRVYYVLSDEPTTIKISGVATFWRTWPTDPQGNPMPADENWFTLTTQEGNGLVNLVQRVRQALIDRLVNSQVR